MSPSEGDQQVKVVVRVRPFNKRGQEELFEHVGTGVLENAFDGYNACIFAYGQTGSGKSYSMMGNSEQPGVIPRLCNAIFQRIEVTTSESLAYKVEVSYMEIYNERVRDLLDPKNSRGRHLKVREHKILGPIVDGLSELAVSSYDQISRLIDEGNKSRTVAATNMNAESSRSHAVFIIRLTQTLIDVENSFSGEKVAKISLVDLAGSERAQKSGAVGKRLEEGGNINKSLTTLGMVISALAERSSSKKEKFVPYRDSVLTWLLKDSLGGNSKTVMIATISPSSDNYEETLSTLRYSDRAKSIVNHAVVNEDPNARVIRELREEVETLRLQISQTKREHCETEELRERLAESERLVQQMNKSWEERLRETDELHKERQRELADIGVSLASGGIKVEKNRFYLVNLNADPAMNELLVYYINNKALVGSAEVDSLEENGNEVNSGDKVDILLQGFGVQKKHARIEIITEEGRQRMYITPLKSDARICVNGSEISERTLLRNGFRLLIGLNHFFRVNCPKEDLMCASIMDESALFDYDDAWQEANSSANANSMTCAVDEYMEEMTLKHQEDKKAALEQQYEAFERYIHGLTAGGFTPSTPMTPGIGLATPLGTPASHFPPFAFPANPRNSVRSKFFYWAQKRIPGLNGMKLQSMIKPETMFKLVYQKPGEELFTESLARLKVDIVRANALVREANLISSSLNSNRPRTNYDVTLQIPAANLRPSKIKAGSFVCEPVIVVRRTGMSGCQLWSVEQLENKLVEMREAYDDRQKGVHVSPDTSPLRAIPNGFEQLPDGTANIDPFFESHENHCLIGVANVFLEVLFHNIKLDYQVPIISQQGEVAGRLHIEVQRVFESTEEKQEEIRAVEQLLGKVIKCRVKIKRAWSLPQSLSHFVFCQYSFFNLAEMLVVAPTMDSLSNGRPPSSIHFDHTKDFSVVVSEEFLEYVQDDALSIQVWGHPSCGFDDEPNMGVNKEEKIKTLQERWAEVSRRVCLAVQVSELNEEGKYTPVDAHPGNDLLAGGVYQLKQGQQRRISVSVSTTNGGGSLPIVLEGITSVAIGGITDTQRPLDSYQEEDLERIRTEWTAALQNRQRHLEQQINRSPSGKSENEKEREFSLMEQWVALTEERTAVSLPGINSGIPGAPSDWSPPPGAEKHIPVIFLNLNADDMNGELTPEERVPRSAGAYALLPKETSSPFIFLPFVQKSENDCSVACAWDSSLHDDPSLNVPSSSGERIYATVKVTVQLAQPCELQLVLRKRIAIHIYKKASLSERFFRRIVGVEPLHYTSVYYDIVAHLPKSSHEMEDRTSLAKMAAWQAAAAAEADETRLSYIEAYTKSIQAVESMLKLDRLRQECAVSSLLTRKERQNRLSTFGLGTQRMKRAVSLPNAISNPPQSLNLPLQSSLTASSSSAGEGKDSSMENSMSISHSSSMATSLISPLNEKLAGIIEETLREVPPRSQTVPEALSTAQSRQENGNEPENVQQSELTSSSSSCNTCSQDENSPLLLSSLICEDMDNNSKQHSLLPLITLRKGGPLDLNISAL